LILARQCYTIQYSTVVPCHLQSFKSCQRIPMDRPDATGSVSSQYSTTLQASRARNRHRGWGDCSATQPFPHIHSVACARKGLVQTNRRSTLCRSPITLLYALYSRIKRTARSSRWHKGPMKGSWRSYKKIVISLNLGTAAICHLTLIQFWYGVSSLMTET